MRSLSLFLAMFAIPATAFGQYKMDAAGDPAPSGIPTAIAAALQAPGVKILNGSGQVFCELWLMKTAPSESGLTLSTIPVGSLLGAIKFPGKAADRHGRPIKPGTYLLRYVVIPVNGTPANTASAAMVPAASDPGLAAKPSLEEVIAMSTKVSRTTHPAILSLAPGSGKETFAKEADRDWTLNTKIGDTPLAIILAGKLAGNAEN